MAKTSAERQQKYRDKNREEYRRMERERRAKTPESIEKARAKSLSWFNKNKDRAALVSGLWKENNKEKIDVARRKYREDHRELYRSISMRWYNSNKHVARALAAKYEARKLSATPAWADAKKIAAKYEESLSRTKSTGIQHHVDHVIPLRSKYVCGLHCEQNLAVITAKENRLKFNTKWPDMPEEFVDAN